MKKGFKLLIIRNWSQEQVPMRDEVKIETLYFKTYKEALQNAELFLEKNKNSYAKIWNLENNEILFEKTHLAY